MKKGSIRELKENLTRKPPRMQYIDEGRSLLSSSSALHVGHYGNNLHILSMNYTHASRLYKLLRYSVCLETVYDRSHAATSWREFKIQRLPMHINIYYG